MIMLNKFFLDEEETKLEKVLKEEQDGPFSCKASGASILAGSLPFDPKYPSVTPLCVSAQSSLLFSYAYNVAKEGYPVLYITTKQKTHSFPPLVPRTNSKQGEEDFSPLKKEYLANIHFKYFEVGSDDLLRKYLANLHLLYNDYGEGDIAMMTQEQGCEPTSYASPEKKKPFHNHKVPHLVIIDDFSSIFAVKNEKYESQLKTIGLLQNFCDYCTSILSSPPASSDDKMDDSDDGQKKVNETKCVYLIGDFAQSGSLHEKCVPLVLYVKDHNALQEKMADMENVGSGNTMSLRTCEGNLLGERSIMFHLQPEKIQVSGLKWK